MFTSDVSARGVDYPDVSLVVQVLAPNVSALRFAHVGLDECGCCPASSTFRQVTVSLDFLNNLDKSPNRKSFNVLS